MDARRRKQRGNAHKLVLLGESAVGKSSFVLQFVRGQFNEWRESTIGAAFLTQSMTLDDGLSTINFELWDTAGQERFHSLAPMYYRRAKAAIVMYDITSAASLDRAKDWVNELQRQASPDIIVALIGNKLDLVQSSPDNESRRKVSTEEGKAFADENGLLFFEASAKTAENIEPAFSAIAKKILAQNRVEDESAQQNRVASGRTGRVSLHGDDDSVSSSQSCNC